MEFVDRLSAVLVARGWTPYQWAQRAELSDATVANMITRRAKGARPQTLRALASPLPPRLVARALGLRLSPTAPSGCRGANDNEVLRYDGRGEPEAIAQRIAHELAHVAAARGGVAHPHSEASIDRIAMALVLPRAVVRATLARTGLDPLRLLAELPGAPAAWVLLRAAWVARRSVIVRLGGERWAYAPDGAALPPAGAWERDLVAIVRRTERPHRTLLGDEAWPVGFREHLGVVIALRL